MQLRSGTPSCSLAGSVRSACPLLAPPPQLQTVPSGQGPSIAPWAAATNNTAESRPLPPLASALHFWVGSVCSAPRSKREEAGAGASNSCCCQDLRGGIAGGGGGGWIRVALSALGSGLHKEQQARAASLQGPAWPENLLTPIDGGDSDRVAEGAPCCTATIGIHQPGAWHPLPLLTTPA